MADAGMITELEGRINAAMDRIAHNIDQIGGAGAADAQALEAERTAKAALEAELGRAQSAHASELAVVRERAERHVAQMKVLDGALQQLRAANDQLRDNNAKLREANRAGLADATLINAALEAELAALQAQRQAERAEADAIIASLEPLLSASS